MAKSYALTIALKQGAATIATTTYTSLTNTTWTTKGLILSEAERAAITDFNDLRLYVRAHAVNADRLQAASVSVSASKIDFT